MLTLDQALDLVAASIHALIGPVPSVEPRRRLRFYGISGSQQLARFRTALDEELAVAGWSAGHLSLSGWTKVLTLAQRLQAAARPLAGAGRAATHPAPQPHNPYPQQQWQEDPYPSAESASSWRDYPESTPEPDAAAAPAAAPPLPPLQPKSPPPAPALPTAMPAPQKPKYEREVLASPGPSRSKPAPVASPAPISSPAPPPMPMPAAAPPSAASEDSSDWASPSIDADPDEASIGNPGAWADPVLPAELQESASSSPWVTRSGAVKAQQLEELLRQYRQQSQQSAQQASMAEMHERFAAAHEAADKFIRMLQEESTAVAEAPPATRPSPAGRSPTRRVEATPQMDFTGPATTSPTSGELRYPLALSLGQQAAPAGAVYERFAVDVPVATNQLRVDLWMDTSPHFRVENLPADAHLTLTVASGTSDPLPVTLVLADRTSNQPMYVSAFFRYEGRPSGKITRFLTLTGDRLTWQAGPPAPARGHNGEVTVPNAGSPASVAIEPGAKLADIRIEVTATGEADGRHYCLTCHTPAGDWSGPWTLPQPSRELVAAYLDNVMKQSGATRIAALRGAGIQLWKALPQGAADTLLAAVATDAKTLSVVSQEPYLPWELMVPHRKLLDAGDPLGVRFAIGRWNTGDYVAPPQRLPLASAFIVSPSTSGLSSSADELTFLEQTLKDARPLTPATIAAIDTALAAQAAPPRDLLHFICHGKSDTLQKLLLDTPDELDCVTVLQLRGFLAALAHRPIVFLNACEVGAQVPGMGGLGGFASAFLEMGASAVVAPLWPVGDKSALEVTRTFYPGALAGRAFADILREIRGRAYQGDNPRDSYAAYCFYGDPLATVANPAPAGAPPQ